MPVAIRTEGEPREGFEEKTRSAAERMLLALGMPDAELSILLCDDKTIHVLNRDYRDRDRATDVLAFAMREGEGAGVCPQLLGDVVISIETATRQADSAGKTIVNEIVFLLAHGLLHLLGYDHQTSSDQRVMSAFADGLVAAARFSDSREPVEN